MDRHLHMSMNKMVKKHQPTRSLQSTEKSLLISLLQTVMYVVGQPNLSLISSQVHVKLYFTTVYNFYYNSYDGQKFYSNKIMVGCDELTLNSIQVAAPALR